MIKCFYLYLVYFERRRIKYDIEPLLLFWGYGRLQKEVDRFSPTFCEGQVMEDVETSDVWTRQKLIVCDK